MDIINIIILSIIQGVTEFLPISSSSHLILVSELTDYPDQGLGFDISLHAGSLLAILIYYRNEIQKIIEGLTRKVHEGEIFSGVVTRIIPIGAFVEILPGKEGMVHISQLSEARVERVEDVIRQGDEVTVRVREIDSRGRINLPLRGVAQNNGGMSYPEPTPTPVAPLS